MDALLRTGYSNDPVTSILKKYKGRKRYHRQQGGGFLKKRRIKNRSTRRRTHNRSCRKTRSTLDWRVDRKRYLRTLRQLCLTFVQLLIHYPLLSMVKLMVLSTEKQQIITIGEDGKLRGLRPRLSVV